MRNNSFRDPHGPYRKNRFRTLLWKILLSLAALLAVSLITRILHGPSFGDPGSGHGWQLPVFEAGAGEYGWLPDPDTPFYICYMDVGQGDSTLISCDGHALLIDGGHAENRDHLNSVLKRLRIRSLDYIVCTHEHEDHAGGLSGALSMTGPDTLFLSPVTEGGSESLAFRYLKEEAAFRGLDITVPSPGDTYPLGSASFTILGPVTALEDVNDNCLCLRLSYKEHAFLFTGDAGAEEEASLLDARADLSCDVLKAGHHGSSAATTPAFLKAASPAYAVISCGIDNEYGHPAPSTLQRLRDGHVTVLRTDLQGNIVLTEDENGTLCFAAEKNAGADVYSTPSR